MKTSMSILVGMLLLGTGAAFAGPDFQAIEQARKARQASQADRHGDRVAAAPAKCPPAKLAPMVDHGPRAQITPYQNRLRQERHEAQVRACKSAG